MKKIISLLLILFVFTVFAEAQKLEKSEKKALKKELRSHKKDLAGYKNQKEETAQKIQSQQDSIQELKARNAALAAENARAKATESQLNDQIAHLEEMMRNCTGEAPAGEAFKVQIGFFKQSEIIKTLSQRKFVIEEDEGGKKYLIGFFKTPDEALQFRDDIKKMGVKDAFVVKYRNGQRTKEEVKRPWE